MALTSEQIAALEQLAGLRESGAINDEEFVALKSKILADTPTEAVVTSDVADESTSEESTDDPEPPVAPLTLIDLPGGIRSVNRSVPAVYAAVAAAARRCGFRVEESGAGALLTLHDVRGTYHGLKFTYAVYSRPVGTHLYLHIEEGRTYGKKKDLQNMVSSLWKAAAEILK